MATITSSGAPDEFDPPSRKTPGRILVRVGPTGSTVYRHEYEVLDYDGDSSVHWIVDGVGFDYWLDQCAFPGDGVYVIEDITVSVSRVDGWETDDEEDWNWAEPRPATPDEIASEALKPIRMWFADAEGVVRDTETGCPGADALDVWRGKVLVLGPVDADGLRDVLGEFTAYPTMEALMAKKYTADLWGSHKDEGNDDNITGTEHDTLEEARAGLEALKNSRHFRGQWAYACIEGPNGRVHEETNPDYRPTPDDDGEWRREFAMQQGMGHGVGAYNEANGCELGEPEDAPAAPGMR